MASDPDNKAMALSRMKVQKEWREIWNFLSLVGTFSCQPVNSPDSPWGFLGFYCFEVVV